MSSWYIVKVLPGKEKQLCETFNNEIKFGKIKNITRFICPTEKNLVSVNKKKVLRDKVIYTGYLYFESEEKLSPEDLKYVASQPSVMAMFGEKTPKILNRNDVEKILKDETLLNHNEVKKNRFSPGEEILINDGAFKGFKGNVISLSDTMVEIEIMIFGKGTKITLDIDQILKI